MTDFHFDRPATRSNHLEPNSMYRQECLDYVFIDAYSTLDTIYSKDGNPLATRFVQFDQSSPAVNATIDFQSGGKKYELKDDFKTAKEVYVEKVDQNGKGKLSKLEAGSDEYKNAVKAADDLGFNTLPSCSSVFEGT